MPPIPAIRNNLTDLAAALTDPQLLGLPAEHCVSVLNPPTPQDVTTPILGLSDEAQDTLLVYYAGHGLIDEYDSTFVLASRR